MFRRSSNTTNMEQRNDNNKNNKICFNCKRPGHFARDCRALREVKSTIRNSQNTRVTKRTQVFKHKEKKPKKKVAWSEEDETYRQTIVKCAKAFANAEQEVLSIPGTSADEDITYAVSLLNEQNRAETWPERFEPKYDLSLAESPVKEALVAGRILIEFSNLTAKLHQELNYDPYWAINETSRIFSKVRGVEYDGDNLEWYDLGECDNSMEGLYTKKCISMDSNIF
ncbi:hypothetical protein C1645_789248 [Glomus cerebriforme]|uniref:CCHC-type domain-containing protein n=1 Tax=Glomus cerebriforme TaxID=658196 RepID=A0A397SHJ5_9GLOM|nr:hypothetical protein C1645_789248 [Glomus cerebriforme]